MSARNRVGECSKAAIPHLIVIVAIVAIVVARYHSVFFGGSIIAEPIFRQEIEPLIVFFRGCVKAGSLPLWNPYCYMGMPQLPGHFPGVFYPLNCLLVFRHNAGAIFLASHQIVAAASVYLLSFYLGKNMMARLVASFSYLLLHLYVVGEYHLTLAAGLAWLPLCVFGILKCLHLRGESRPHVASLLVINSLAAGLMLTAGCLALSGMLVSAAIVSFLILKREKSGQPRMASLVSLLVSIGLSICLSAPVLLPLVEWITKQPEAGMARSPLPMPSPAVLAGPATMRRSDYEKSMVKSNSIMQNMWSWMGHYGRYLCVFERDKPATAFYQTAPNGNVIDFVPSSAGFLGHPTPSYSAIAARAELGDLSSGYADLPKNLESAERLIRFSEVTGTKLLITPGFDLPDGVSNRISNGKSLNPILNQVPDLQFLQLYGALPEAYAIDSWQWMSSENELIERLFGGTSRIDLSKTLLVEKTVSIEIDEDRLDKMPFYRVDPPKGPPLTDALPAVSGGPTLKVLEKLVDSPVHVALSAKVDKPCFVVLNSASYPGWKGYVDGAPVPMYRANGIARAVFVLEGSHLVEFDFRPDSVKLGCTLSIAALIVEALLLFWWLLGFMKKTVNWMSYGVFE